MVAFGLAVAGHAAVIAIAAPRPDGADGERAAGTPDVVWGLPVAAIADDVTALQPGEQDPATVPPSGVEVAEAVPPPDAGAEIVTEAIDPSEMAVAEAIRPPEAAPAAASTETPALDTDAVDEVGAAAVATARDITPPLPRPRPQRVKRAPAQRTVAAPATDPKADRRDRGVARGAAAPAGRQAGDGGKRREHGGSSDFASYSGRVAAHLQRHKRYPRAAARQRIGGIATLTFTIERGGAVQSVRLSRGSGHVPLDTEALAMVRRAAPFPPIPPDLARSTMTFTVPVRFAPE